MKLLLFDIDGTLVDAFGAGREAVEDAFRDVTGHAVDSGGFSFSGKTDPQIVRDLLIDHGFPRDGRADLASLTERVLDRYADRLAETINKTPVDALPGTPAKRKLPDATPRRTEQLVRNALRRKCFTPLEDVRQRRRPTDRR